MLLSGLTVQAETVRDNFDSAVFTGNNGTQNWSTDWIELNESDGAASGDILITTDNGDTRLQIKSKNEGVQREADLTGATTATLSFVYRRQALDDVDDYVSIEISGDGGISWAELDRFTGAATDAVYQNVNYDITSYIASNTQIRFLSSPGMGKVDIIFFDDVQIDYTIPAVAPHFSISHDGLGTNCAEENITIAFHDGTHTVDTTYTGTITLSTSTSTGDWSLVSGSGTLVNSGNGAGSYVFNVADNGQVVLGLSDDTTATVNINVTDGTYSEGVTEDDDISFTNTVTNTYADDFSIASFNNSTGTLAWSTDWLEINETDGAGSGDVRVSQDGGDDRLLLRNASVGIKREFNTSTATAATLQFDYRRSNLKAGDVVTLAISSDGGGSWATLDTFAGAANDASYQPASYNISAYKSLNTVIRFTTSAGMATNTRLYVDNVVISVNAPDTCGGLDHFAINVTTSTGACDLGNADITIIAQNLNNDIVTGYTGLINLSVSNNLGDWYTVTAGGTLDNGTADDGAATYQFVAGDSGAVTLNLGMSVTATVSVTVQDASAGVSSTSSGFNLASGTQSFSIVNDSIQVAGRPQAMIISKLNSDCSVNTGYNETVPVKAWLTRDGTDPGGAAPTISSVSLPDTEPVSDNLTGANALAFVNGETSINLDTSDIGKYVLNIKETSHTANSPTVITRPFGFDIDFSGLRLTDFNVDVGTPVIDGDRFDDDDGKNTSYSINENGDPFAVAGQTFSTTITAMRWQSGDDDGGGGSTANDGIPDADAFLGDNIATASFGGEGATVSLISSIVAPAAGNSGTLYVNSIGAGNEATSIAGFSDGSSTVNLVWDEVGIIDISANITGNNYWGSGVDVTGVVNNVGRFIPNHFALSAGSITNRSALACGTTYTYMEEAFSANFTLTAQNAANGTTTNYNGVYAKLPISDDSAVLKDLNFGAVNDPGNTHTELTSRLDVAGVPTGSWANGVAAINYPVAVFKNATEDGPFDLFNLGVAAEDSDGVKMNSFDLDTDGTLGNDHTTITSTKIWFGRIALSNAYGSELLDLNIPMVPQYFDGAGFIVTPDDTCTTPATITITDVTPSDSMDATADTCVLDNGNPGVSGSGCTPAADPALQYQSPPIIVGTNPTYNLYLQSPGTGKTGEADVTAIVPAYMQYDWDGDNVHNNNPSARATFGIYKGKTEVIFIREGR